MKRLTVIGITFLFALISVKGAPEPASGENDLTGIWEARRHFGPEVRGPLILSRHGDTFFAEIGSFSVPATVRNKRIFFELPDGKGSFRGRFENDESGITGHWIQPSTIFIGNAFASPVYLLRTRQDRWNGEVTPLDDDMTMYLAVRRGENGSPGAFLRNPERNVGVFLNAHRLEREGNRIKLIGTFFRNDKEMTLAEGFYDEENQRLALYVPSAGGSFDFERVEEAESSPFYPRGKNPAEYVYMQPAQEDDGWRTSTLQDVGIAEKPIRALIEKIIHTPDDSVHSSRVHGVLIARYGKLVLEEYFLGFHRGMPHDTRSASKSLTSTLIGVAIHNGVNLNVSDRVYEVIHGGSFPAELDPRKRLMTVEHLMTMSSGFHCDDNDSSSPGNEDVMQGQAEEPDWYRYTLNLPMIRNPGEKAVYCSANANLLGLVLQKATGQKLPEFFQDSFARPMQIKRYFLNLMPTGDAYMGGGIQWMPRDFLKLGQLLLNDGEWNGNRLLDPGWARRASSPLYEMREQQYGYAWWIKSFPYGDGTVTAYYAGGNGGQYVIVVPDLDLVVSFFGGNYSDRALYIPRDDFLPNYILPAVSKSASPLPGPASVDKRSAP